MHQELNDFLKTSIPIQRQEIWARNQYCYVYKWTPEFSVRKCKVLIGGSRDWITCLQFPTRTDPEGTAVTSGP